MPVSPEVMLCSLLGLCFMGAQQARAQPAMARSVETAQIERREVAPTIRLVGTVRPQLRTVVASEVSGLVAEMPVREGDKVSKGDLLCRLREEQRRLAQEEAKGRLAELGDVVAERAADLRKAEFEAQRMEGLYKLERCTEKELRDAQAAFEAAGGRHRQSMNAMVSYEATVERMADDLARLSILAPCDGFVVSKLTEIGSWVNQGGAIVEIVDISTARVRVPVPEAAAPWCKPGEETVVHIDALDRDYAGRIARRVPDADLQARTVPIEVDVPNPDNEMMAGMFARVSVPSGPKRSALVVPKDAVVVRGPQQMVFAVNETPDGAMAVPVSITIVAELEDRVAVTGPGLESSRLVVVRGNEYMFGPTNVALSPTARAILEAKQPPSSQPSGASTQPATPKKSVMGNLLHDATTPRILACRLASLGE